LEAEMRKQDRIRQQQSDESSRPQPGSPPEPRRGEDVKGSASTDQQNKPPRQTGKLPLPE
jgi:hypothetical protein